MGSTKHIETQLSAALLQGLLKCVTEQLKAYLSSTQAQIRRIIQKSKLPDEVKHQLHTLNQSHAWLHPHQWNDTTFTCLGHLYWPSHRRVTDDYGNQLILENTHKLGVLIPLSTLRLMRQIAQRVLARSPLIKPQYARLLLDSRTCQFTESKQSTHFQHWLNVTTLTKGKRVNLPVHYHVFAKQTQGDFNNSVELLFRDNQLKLVLTKTQAVNEWREQFVQTHLEQAQKQKTHSTSEVVALDMGLCTLLASSEGGLYGQYWLKQLSYYDQKLTAITSQRQTLGLKEWGGRQKQIVQQVRGFIKTEIGRILNQWVLSHPRLKTVIIEKLAFQNPNLSKQLNRIIKNFGLSRIKSKLAELGVLYGFKVVEVNPAYSSQECRHCGWVSEYNRKTQAQFHCELCGKCCHADTGASCTLHKRFVIKAHWIGLTKGQCLIHLRTQFVESLGSKVCQGIVDPYRLAHILMAGTSIKRGFIKDRAGLALLTEALKEVKPSLVAS